MWKCYLVGTFNQEKALVGAFSVIVKTDCGTDGALHSTSWEYWRRTSPLSCGHEVRVPQSPAEYGTKLDISPHISHLSHDMWRYWAVTLHALTSWPRHGHGDGTGDSHSWHNSASIERTLWNYLSDTETKLFKNRQNNRVPQFINFQKSPHLQARQNRQWLNNSLSMLTTETDNGQRNARSHFRQKSPKSTETGLWNWQWGQ